MGLLLPLNSGPLSMLLGSYYPLDHLNTCSTVNKRTYYTRLHGAISAIALILWQTGELTCHAQNPCQNIWKILISIMFNQYWWFLVSTTHHDPSNAVIFGIPQKFSDSCSWNIGWIHYTSAVTILVSCMASILISASIILILIIRFWLDNFRFSDSNISIIPI